MENVGGDIINAMELAFLTQKNVAAALECIILNSASEILLSNAKINLPV